MCLPIWENLGRRGRSHFSRDRKISTTAEMQGSVYFFADKYHCNGHALLWNEQCQNASKKLIFKGMFHMYRTAGVAVALLKYVLRHAVAKALLPER